MENKKCIKITSSGIYEINNILNDNEYNIVSFNKSLILCNANKYTLLTKELY